MNKLEKPEVLLSEQQLAEKVKELGATITDDYPEGEHTIVGVLKGSFL